MYGCLIQLRCIGARSPKEISAIQTSGESLVRIEKQREMDGFGKQKKRVASESIHGGMPLEGITRQLFLLIAPPQNKQFPIEFVT